MGFEQVQEIEGMQVVGTEHQDQVGSEFADQLPLPVRHIGVPAGAPSPPAPSNGGRTWDPLWVWSGSQGQPLGGCTFTLRGGYCAMIQTSLMCECARWDKAMSISR